MITTPVILPSGVLGRLRKDCRGGTTPLVCDFGSSTLAGFLDISLSDDLTDVKGEFRWILVLTSGAEVG